MEIRLRREREEVETKLRVRGRTLTWERKGGGGVKMVKKRGLEREQKGKENGMGPMWKDFIRISLCYMKMESRPSGGMWSGHLTSGFNQTLFHRMESCDRVRGHVQEMCLFMHNM